MKTENKQMQEYISCDPSHMQYLRMKTDSQLSGTENDNKDRLQNGLVGWGKDLWEIPWNWSVIMVLNDNFCNLQE